MTHSTALQLEKLGTIEKKGTSFLWVQWKDGIYHEDRNFAPIIILHLSQNKIQHWMFQNTLLFEVKFIRSTAAGIECLLKFW